tara:strand:- start:362 stop:619 length:258 start_codon:yes stop_codon:yes gene_type:complete
MNNTGTRNQKFVKYIDAQASQISSIDIEYVSNRPHELDKISVLTSGSLNSSYINHHRRKITMKTLTLLTGAFLSLGLGTAQAGPS